MSKRDRWNERYASSELVWSAGPNSLFAEIAADLPPGRALDVAAGEGRNAIWLAEQGWQVDAIDFSDAGIEKGRRIAERRGVALSWIVGDVCEYQFEPAIYDLIAVLFLHTSAEERERWLPALVRALRPGGRLVYIAHDPANIEEGVGGPQDRSLLVSLEELERSLAGFDIERAEVWRRQVEADPGHGGEARGVALDTLFVARKPQAHEI